jgi:hypothetical protein
MTLATLTAGSFANRVGDTFTLSSTAGALALVLKEVEELGEGQSRRAFSLRFIGPARPIMPQAIYRLEHPEMGALEPFLVPLGPRVTAAFATRPCSPDADPPAIRADRRRPGRQSAGTGSAHAAR